MIKSTDHSIKSMNGTETGKLRFGAVAAANAIGTDTGIQILKSGGNAVDAAIATAHVMGVVEPLDCGIGAGGFMIIFDAQKNKIDSVDFLGTAPALAHYRLYSANDVNGEYVIRVLGQHNQIGHRSVATPGTARGFSDIHFQYGRLPMAELLEPAIEVAKNGFRVSYKSALRMRRTKNILQHTEACRKLYLKSDGCPYSEGETIFNVDYANSLKQLAKEGPDIVYSGEIGKAIAKEMAKNDGFLTIEDLSNYAAIRRTPAKSRYIDLDVATMAPPSSGTLVFSGLDALPKSLFENRFDTHEALAISMLHMFSRRNLNFGDPAFNNNIIPIECPETTSLCTLDREGNAACITYSNNNHSGVVVPGTGILLNNQMALFNPWSNNPNEISPRKRPISSMMPSLLLRGGRIEMIIGASGSTRILTSLMQVLYRTQIQQKSLFQAIEEPKLHAEMETLLVDEDLSELAESLARKLRLNLKISPGRDTTMGVVQAIHSRENGLVTAIGDPRAGAQGRVK